MSNSETLPDGDEQFIQRQLDSGRYHDRNAVLHAGLRILEEFEDDGFDRWMTDEIPCRYAELMQDPSNAISFEDAFADFEAMRQAELATAK